MNIWIVAFIAFPPNEILSYTISHFLHKSQVFLIISITKLYKMNKILRLSKRYSYFDTIVKFDKGISKYSKQENTKMISNILGGNGIFKETFLKEYFDENEIYNFENTQLLGAKNYDAILTQMYSDYMSLPKEENRVCKHCLQLKKVN